MKAVLLNIGRVGHWRASAKRFKDIFDRVPLSAIIAMYPTFHEMDISRFIASMDRRYDESVSDTKLKKICESRKISQSQLPTLSGVNLRSIQLYEQRVNDIKHRFRLFFNYRVCLAVISRICLRNQNHFDNDRLFIEKTEFSPK